MRSFVLVCQELGISDVEYENLSGRKVNNTSVQEWADYDVTQFTESQKLLSKLEKKILASYLKRCVEALRL